jgi:hypothetical protein
MTGETFYHEARTRAVEHGRLAHRDRVELTWRMLDRFGHDDACQEVTEGLRQIASAHGRPERYHETITQFWIRLLAHIKRRSPDAVTFDAMVRDHPFVLDKDLPERHWTREVLFGTGKARSSWVEPDRLAVPQDMQGNTSLPGP